MTFDKELVSVIVPAFNAEKYIAECIKSVQSQTYEKWEMIIVDDCSTDSTVSIIENFIKKDSRIKLFTLRKNSGAAKARNMAISKSNGRFIAFLDADDMWKSDKLNKQIKFMTENEYVFTFTSYEMYRVKSGRRKRIKVPHKINYKQYLKNTIIGNLTVILDRENLGDIRVEIGELEDVLTWMKILRCGVDAYGLDIDLATYRVLDTSVSSNKINNAIKYYKLLRQKQNLNIFVAIYSQFCYMFNAARKRIG